MSKETNAAPAPEPGQAVAAIAPPSTLATLFAREDRPTVCSFDLATPVGRELLQKVEEAGDESLRELVGQEIAIEHVYGKVFDYVNPTTGETYPLLRIAVATADGKVHACCSDGVRESILRLIAGHKLPPWRPAVRVKVAQKITAKKFNRLVLLEVFDKPKGGKS